MGKVRGVGNKNDPFLYRKERSEREMPRCRSIKIVTLKILLTNRKIEILVPKPGTRALQTFRTDWSAEDKM